MKKGRMNKKQKEIKTNLNGLLWQIFRECGINDKDVNIPDEMKSSLFRYKNNQNNNGKEILKVNIRIIQTMVEKFIMDNLNSDYEDLNRVYLSFN